MKNNPVFLITWVVFILFMVFLNWWSIVKKNKRPDYELHNIIKICVGAVFFVLCHLNIWFIPYAVFSYWLLFNIVLNISRKLPYSYIDTEEDAAWTDKLQVWLFNRNIPVTAQMLFMLIIIMLSINNYMVGTQGFIDQINGNYNWDNFIW